MKRIIINSLLFTFFYTAFSQAQDPDVTQSLHQPRLIKASDNLIITNELRNQSKLARIDQSNAIVSNGSYGMFEEFTDDNTSRLPQYKENTNLGDINGDGNDDLAILYVDRVDIFLGGANSQNADFTINTDHIFVEMTSGDFNGDGLADLIVVELEIGDGQNFDRALIFYGSANFNDTIDQTITTQQIAPSEAFPFTLSSENIGDVNNDGNDDAILYIPLIDEIFVFLGGDSFSSSPDITINTAGDDYGITGLSSDAMTFGTRFQQLGDINDDGIDDFAMADIGRDYDPGGGFKTDGAVFVYFGSSNPTFSDPDEILYLSEASTNGFDLFGLNMAVGDYNGDNINDLVVTPSTFEDPNSTSDPKDGGAGFFVYFGGSTFDDQYDLNFSVTSDLVDGLTKEYVGRGELIGIPDIDNDGLDELYFNSSFVGSNSILLGADFKNDVVDPALEFESPNPSILLGRRNTAVNFLFNSSVGDFDGNGVLDIILPQIGDPNFRNDPVYSFPLDKPEDVLGLDQSHNEDLIFYPNPVIEYLSIQLVNQKDLSKVSSINIYSLSGSLVIQVNVEDEYVKDQRINVRGLPVGTYVVKVVIDGNSVEKKVIIK